MKTSWTDVRENTPLTDKSLWLTHGLLSLLPFPMRGLYLVYIVLLCTFAPFRTWGQEADTLRSVSIRGEAEVVHRKNRSALRGSEAGLTQWDMSRLQRLPQILGNADPLRYVQMLPMTQTSNEFDGGLHVQGCASGQNAVLLSDAVVYNPIHLLGLFSTFNASHFPTLTFSTLSSVAQPNRLGGMLRMELPLAKKEKREEEGREKTRNERNDPSARFDRGEKQFGDSAFQSADLNFQSGDPENQSGDSENQSANSFTQHGELSVGPLSSQGTWRLGMGRHSLLTVSARGAYMNLFYGRWLKFDDQQARYSFGDYNLTFSSHVAPRHAIGVNLYFGNDRVRYDNDLHLLQASLRWHNVAAEASWTYTAPRLTLRQSLTASAYRSCLRLDQHSMQLEVPSHIRTYAYKASGQSGSFRFGADAEWHDVLPQAPRITASYSTDLETTEKQTAHEVSLFGKWEQSFGAGHLTPSVGLRATVFHTPDSKYYFSADPEAALAYRPAPLHKLSLHFALRHQYLHQSGFTSLGMPTEFWFPSSRTLPPQWAESVSLLYDGATANGGWRFTFEAYYKHLHHQKEYADDVLSLLTASYSLQAALLQGSGTNYGVGVQVVKQTGKLTGWVSYAFGRSLRHFDREPFAGTFPSSYERLHEANIVVAYEPVRRLSFSLTGVLTSGTPFTFPEQLYYVGGYVVTQYGKRNTRRLPTYKRIDLAVNYTLKPRRRIKHSLNLSLYNAFGFDNVSFYRLKLSETYVGYRSVSFMKFPLPSVCYNLNW